MPSPLRVRTCFLVVLPSMALPAAALDMKACAERPVQWGCIGHVEMRSAKARVEMTGCEKREVLMEVEQEGVRRRMLVTNKGAFVAPGDDIGANRGAYAFWGYALAPVLMVLPMLFPDGPDSVPVEPLTRTIQVESNTTATVTASRGADGAIRFRMAGDRFGRFEGSYRSGLRPALPGDFDMRGWYHAPGPSRIGEPPPAPEPAPGERLEQLR